MDRGAAGDHRAGEEPAPDPPVVEPEPPEATEADELTLDDAAATTRAALSEPPAATAAPTPHKASTAPGHPAEHPAGGDDRGEAGQPGQGQRPGRGTRSWPVTVTTATGAAAARV